MNPTFSIREIFNKIKSRSLKLFLFLNQNNNGTIEKNIAVVVQWPLIHRCSENKIVVWIYHATPNTNVSKSDLPRTSCKSFICVCSIKDFTFPLFSPQFPLNLHYLVSCAVENSKCSSNGKHSKSTIAFGKTPQ